MRRTPQPKRTSRPAHLISRAHRHFGTYKQSSDGNGGYNDDPIKWRVLSNADGKLFLLSDQNLDVFRYHQEYESVTWETSTMRSWLNGLADNNGNGNNTIDYTNDNFLDTAFSAGEQAAIADTTVVNNDNPSYGADGGNNTTDKVFLLSIEEAQNTAYGFTDNTSSTDTRKATNTAYVADGGKIGISGMYGVGEANYWWLRSPGYDTDLAADVYDFGDVNVDGFTVGFDYNAVRPAFNINLSSVLFTSAADGSAQTTFGAIADYTGKDWKVTVKDGTSFAEGTSVNKTALNAGESLTITHKALSAISSDYTNVTAVLTDSNNNILYYGSINDSTSATSSTVTIPAGLEAGEYTLSVYGEDWNGAKMTDFATGTPFTTSITVASPHIHPLCGESSCTDTTHAVSGEWTEWISSTSLPDEAGNYYLTENVNVSGEWNAPSGETKICLNGKTLSTTQINVANGNTLSVSDCGNGAVRANGGFYSSKSVVKNAGTFNLYGGSITGNVNWFGQGGGVFNEGTFNMYGGAVTNNSATLSGGGGVYNKSGAVFNLYGGSVTGNKGGTGGGLYNGGKFNMYGGEITGNKTDKDSCGGVYSANRINISGKVVISGNTNKSGAPSNYCSANNGAVMIVGALETGSSIGVTRYQNIGTITTGGDEYVDYFFSDNAQYFVEKDGDNLKISEKEFSVTVTVNDNAYGTASANKNSGKKGTYVILSAVPATGYRLKEWSVLSGGVTVSRSDDDFFFIRTEDVVIQAVFEEIPPHTHDWNYFVNEAKDTITATCENTDGLCENTNGGSVTLTVSDAYFTGSAIGATAEGNFTNGATYKITYNGSETAPSAVGTHTATLTVSEGGTEKQSVSGVYKIDYLPAPNPAYIISGYTYKGENTYWFKGGAAVTVNASAEYTISKTLNGTYGDSVSFSESDSEMVYLKNADGEMTDAIAISETLSFDKDAPTGKIAIDSRNFWEKLLNKITFGMFFKGDTVAAVTATDTDSGVKSIEYYVSSEDLIADDTLDNADAIAKLETAIGDKWSDYNDKIPLAEHTKNVIYVKMTDNVGNVTYMSSDGIVLDSIAPDLYGIENGGVYYGDKIFKATDDNFLKIEVDGLEITDTTEGDDEYKIVADNAQHTVTVTDKAGNVTEYKITVYKRYTVTFVAEGEGGSYEKEVKYGEVITIPTNDIFEDTFRKTGYTLTGWQGYTEGMTMPLDNLTFTAVYTPNNYTVEFDANGGEPIAPVTVTFGEKYGRLPSSAITGLSGGNSNWYLVDQYGNVTDTNIKNLTKVSVAGNHTLFVKRRVLSPNVSISLTVPGGISDGYQYYIPGASQRVLTVTVGNMNTDVLNYTYEWYKDGEIINDATSSILTLEGNVADSGTYKVKVTATLKDGSNIIVTSDTASAEKEKKVKILHAANTLYYDANGGEGGPSSNYTGGATITVSDDTPTREHYVFSGWNTKADGTGDKYTGGVIYSFAGDNGNGGCETTLYAQWKLVEYTVIYKADGEVVDTVTVEHGKDATAPVIPEKEGYTAAWDKDGNAITVDTEINAVYTLKEYTVTFIDENGVYKTVTVKHGEKVTMPEAPKKDGYTVTWEKVLDTVTGDTTVKAVYAEIPASDTPNSPQTRDNTNLWLWFAFLFVSGLSIFGITLSERKRKTVNKR